MNDEKVTILGVTLTRKGWGVVLAGLWILCVICGLYLLSGVSISFD